MGIWGVPWLRVPPDANGCAGYRRVELGRLLRTSGFLSNRGLRDNVCGQGGNGDSSEKAGEKKKKKSSLRGCKAKESAGGYMRDTCKRVDCCLDWIASIDWNFCVSFSLFSLYPRPLILTVAVSAEERSRSKPSECTTALRGNPNALPISELQTPPSSSLQKYTSSNILRIKNKTNRIKKERNNAMMKCWN